VTAMTAMPILVEEPANPKNMDDAGSDDDVGSPTSSRESNVLLEESVN
jgi:hypothetical protein